MARPRAFRTTIVWGLPTGMEPSVGKNHRIWLEAGRWIGARIGEVLEAQKEGEITLQLQITGPRQSKEEERLAELELVLKASAKAAEKKPKAAKKK